jgi:hypothetical protein
LSSDTTLTPHITAFLEQQGYTSYHPFGRYPGMAYPLTVKTFIAPPSGQWTRILIETTPDTAHDLAAHLSHASFCLSAALDNRVAFLRFYENGAGVELETGLMRHAPSDQQNRLHHILHAETLALPPLDDTTQVGDIALDDLPDDMQAMAQQISDQHADKFFKRWSQQLLKAVKRQNMDSLLDSRPDWHSQGGQLIRGVMDCLTMPDNYWRTPDFAAVRSAYPIVSRQQHDPDAAALPGDEQALRAVPNALDYTPVYGGKMA